MNFKTLSIAAIAAILFSACDKEEIGTPNDNNGGKQNEKNVFLKFNTGSSTLSRSVENSASETTAELHTAMIYFLNGKEGSSVVYAVKQAGGVGGDIPMDALEEGYQFTGIPDGVKYVYVVGNFDNKSENKPAADFPKTIGITLNDDKSTTLDIEQVNVTRPLATMLDGMAEVKEYSESDNTWNSMVKPSAGDYYASVKITPVNTRIEVKEMKYTGELLKELTLEGIYINYYYAQSSLDDLDKEADNKNGVFVNNGADVSKYNIHSEDFAYINYSTLYDLPGASMNEGSDMKIAAGTNKYWSYQVFGNCTPAHLVIKLTDLKDVNGDDVPDDRYITVKGFKKDDMVLTQLNKGTVYQLNSISFSDKDLAITPEPDEISIWVEVSVAPWETEFVSPIL